jgi:hypothetical protein
MACKMFDALCDTVHDDLSVQESHPTPKPTPPDYRDPTVVLAERGFTGTNWSWTAP